MKKNNAIIIGIIVVLVVAVGAYLIFHKSNTSPAYGTTSTPSTSTSKSTVPAVNNAVLKTKTDATVGQYLTDPSGKALYTYGSDTSGVSNCTGTCLANWPAYVDKGLTSGLPTGVSTITRSDNGQVQYAYNGMPLYYFAGDSTDKVTGNGVDSFSVAKPAAASTSTSSGSSSSSTSGTSTSGAPSSAAPNSPY